MLAILINVHKFEWIFRGYLFSVWIISDKMLLLSYREHFSQSLYHNIYLKPFSALSWFKYWLHVLLFRYFRSSSFKAL